jgi:hypothetical protein
MKNDTQNQIIRQSQIKLALDYFNACGVCPTMVDLIKTTAMLEHFVLNGYGAAHDGMEKLDEYIIENYRGR